MSGTIPTVATMVRRSQARFRHRLAIAKRLEWRKTCAARYESLDSDVKAIVDRLERTRLLHAKWHDPRPPKAKSNDKHGPRGCDDPHSWDNAVRASEEDR